LFLACGQESDYAVFYLSRAYLLRLIDEKQEILDLQTALRLAPDNWRTLSRLIDYYENKQDFSMELKVSSAAYRKFKGNYTLALQYATALLNTGDHAACLKILEGIHILPFEGSSQGKVIYEQAYLLLIMDLIRNKKYREAMGMLPKSKEWPENLGVGKPYEPDTRIQDYIEACLLKKLNRSSAVSVLQQSVVDYTWKHFADPSFNNVLALQILKDKGETNKAALLVSQISQSAHPIHQWVVASFKKDTATCNKLEAGFARNRYFSIISALMDCANR
jgi:tetratricopeptide (TPR) repeat protein